MPTSGSWRIELWTVQMVDDRQKGSPVPLIQERGNHHP
jgi:hypothetical protein